MVTRSLETDFGLEVGRVSQVQITVLKGPAPAVRTCDIPAPHQRPLNHQTLFMGFSPARGTDLGRQIPSGAASWVQLLSNMYEQLFISVIK